MTARRTPLEVALDPRPMEVAIERHRIGAALGAELRRRRRARGLSQREAAQIIGISQGFLWFLEQGHRAPRGEVAEALIEVLRIDPWAAAALRAIAASVDHGRAGRAAERQQA